MLTIALAASTLTANAQLGVITLERNHKTIPLGFWYVVNGKGFENQMFFAEEDSLAKIKFDSLLLEYDLDPNKPAGKDSVGDPYWIVNSELGYVTWIYYIKSSDTHSTITIATK